MKLYTKTSLSLLLLLPLLVLSLQSRSFSKTGGDSKTDFSLSEGHVLTGADILLSHKMDMIRGKRLGIVTNHSALLSNGVHLVDTLNHIKGITISALFGPEHGIRGNAPDGVSLSHGTDAKTGLKVYSLYGKTNKPTPEMLKDIDVLIYDIQDVGARFYTFISTLYYVLQAGAENNIPVIVLDRPNPVTGENVEGPVRAPELKSFVGIAPIPIMHGMTIGELAGLFAYSGMLETAEHPKLTVVKMENWKRSYYYDQCGLNWVNPSPNIPGLETALVYPGMCLIEGTNISEGRGTMQPFLTIGAPFIEPEQLIAELRRENIKGAEFSPASFTPEDIPNMASSPKFKGQRCKGISIRVTDRKDLDAVALGTKVVNTLARLYPDDFKFSDSRFDKLSGDASVRTMIASHQPSEKIISSWQEKLNDFKTLRMKYLLYK